MTKRFKHYSRLFLSCLLMVVLLISAWSGIVTFWPSNVDKVLASVDTYTTSTTWTAPEGVTSVQVEVWGGGGGGGGQNLGSDGGGGGGGGAYSKKNTVSVTPGNSYTVTVGTGGNGGTAGCGTAGGDSWFSTTGTVLAKGGSPGCNSTGTPPAGGAGGASTSGVGDTKFSGGQGEIARNSNSGSGGYGGSSAGTGSDGFSGPQSWSTVNYPTGSTPTGAGDGGDAGGANSNGSAPATGNGGGGGGSGDGTNKTGGNGAAGKVVITYTIPPTVLDQSGYGFYANQNSAAAGTPLAATNTPATMTSAGEAFRLRTLIDVSTVSLAQNAKYFNLQYATTSSAAVCSAIPAANYSLVGSSTPGAANWLQVTSGAGWSTRRSSAGTVYNNHMWISGGMDKASSVRTNEVWYSDDGANWYESTAGASWAGRTSHGMLTFNNKMWVMGGNAGGAGEKNDVWYSTDGASWTQATATAEWGTRDSFGAVVFNDKMWIFGGVGASSNYYNDVWYSSDGVSWTQATAAAGWSARQEIGALVYDNKMWIIGGSDSGGTDLHDVWYSSDGVSWTQATGAAAFAARNNMGATVYNNKMYIAAGSPISNDVYSSTDGATWTQVTSGAGFSNRGQPVMLTYNDKMWILGGNTGGSGTFYNDVWSSGGSVFFNDNASVTDGGAFTSNTTNDPKHTTHSVVYENYKESNPFTTASSSIAAGKDGMWDFSLKVNPNVSDNAATDICFRIAQTDGTALNTYDQYPRITVPIFYQGILSSTDVALSSYDMNATSTATIQFTTATAIPANGKIKITFPTSLGSGYTFNNKGTTVAGNLSGLDGTLTVSILGNVVTLTRSGGSSSAPGAKSFTLSNILNPSAAGSTGTYSIETLDSSNARLDRDTAVQADTIVVGPWWHSSWNYRLQLIMNNSAQSTSLSNFPIRVALDSSRIDYSLINDDGSDLRFIDADGSTVLDYEIETWNESGTSTVWVKVPNVAAASSTDKIYMYYGNTSATAGANPTGVWDNNFVAVYHFNETSGNYLDSTSNNLDSDEIAVTSRTTATFSGGIGNYPEFDGGAGTNYIAVPDSNNWDMSNWTVEAYIKSNGAGTAISTGNGGFTTEYPLVTKGTAESETVAADEQFYLGLNSTSTTALDWENLDTDGAGPIVGSQNVPLWGTNVLSTDGTSWYYLAGTVDSTNAIMDSYVDGILDATRTIPSGYSPSVGGTPQVGIGTAISTTNTKNGGFLGNIDEVRISKVVRSSDWIAASNLSTRDLFLTYGAAIPLGTVVLSNHISGQVTNKFLGDSATTTALYGFKLAVTGEAALTTLTFDLSSVSGIAASDITTPQVYVDVNNDGIVSTSSSAWSTSYDTSEFFIYSLAEDTTNHVLYAGSGNGGIIYRCDLSTACDASTDWTVSYDTSQTYIHALTIDTTNNVLYAGSGNGGIIYRCDLSTSCDASTDWTTSYDTPAGHIYSFTVDATNQVLYAGGLSSGFTSIIYRCDLSTACDASTDWTTSYSSLEGSVDSLVIDTTNNVMYSGTQSNGIIIRCALSTACDAVGDWTTSYDSPAAYVRSLIIDPTNHILYAGTGSEGVIYRCALSTACDAAGDWTTSYDSPASYIYSLALDSTHQVIYAGSGTSGTIYRCDLSTACDAAGDWTTSYGYPSTDVYSLITDPTNHILYAGSGSEGVIYRCDLSTGCAGDYPVFSLNGTTTISSGNGTIAFTSTSTIPVGTNNYLLLAKVSNLGAGDTMTVALSTSKIISYGQTSTALITLTGSASNVTHTYTIPSISISGTLFTDFGLTQNTASGKSILLKVNGLGSYSTTTIANTGVWKITGVTAPAVGNPISVWVDGDSSFRAFTMTKASSTSNDITGLDLYKNRVIVRHEGTSGTSTTNADLGIYDGDDNSSVQFTANSNILTVNKGQELYIWPNKTFVPGGPVTLSGNGASAPDGDLYLGSGATYTAGGLTSVAGNWTASTSSTFTQGSNTVAFIATTTGKTITVPTINGSFTTINFNGIGGGWTFTTPATTTSFSISNGSVTAPSGTLYIGGQFSNGGSFNPNSGTVIFNSASSQSITGININFNNITFIGASTKTFSSNASTTGAFTIASSTSVVVAPSLLSIGGNYSNSGTFTNNFGMVYLSGSSAQSLSGNMTGTSAFNDLTLLNSSGSDAQLSPGITFSNVASTTGTFRASVAGVKIIFPANATSTINNLVLNGQSSGNPVTWRSSISGTRFGIEVSGTQSISYLNVKDGSACSGNTIDVSNGTNINGGHNICFNFGVIPTLSTSGDSNFVYNDTSTLMPAFTITDSTSSPFISALNDLRISIASSSISVLWDSTKTSLSFGGTASSKVSSTVSYEGGDSVLLIPVNTSFSAGDTLTVNGAYLKNFTTVTPAVSNVFGLMTHGSGDTTVDTYDSNIATIRGTLTMSSATVGQEANQLNSNIGSLTATPLYLFKLMPVGENDTLPSLTFTLENSGFVSSDITNAKLYVDYNGNGSVDAGDTQVGGAGMTSINGSLGTITFSSSFTATTTRDYILTADISNITAGKYFTIYLRSLSASGVISLITIPPSGVIPPVVHRRFYNFYSGGGSAGYDTSPNGSNQTGGGAGGGTSTTTTPTGNNQTGGGAGGGGGVSI